MHLTFEALGVGDDGQQLVAWLAADEATAAALRGAPADDVPLSPAQLRVIREA